MPIDFQPETEGLDFRPEDGLDFKAESRDSRRERIKSEPKFKPEKSSLLTKVLASPTTEGITRAFTNPLAPITKPIGKGLVEWNNMVNEQVAELGQELGLALKTRGVIQHDAQGREQLVNVPVQPSEIIPPIAPDQPLIQFPLPANNDRGSGFRQAVREFPAKFASGLTTPELAPELAAAAAYPPAAAPLFMPSMSSGAIESFQQAINPDLNTKERTSAALGALANAAFAGGVGRTAIPKPEAPAGLGAQDVVRMNQEDAVRAFREGQQRKSAAESGIREAVPAEEVQTPVDLAVMEARLRGDLAPATQPNIEPVTIAFKPEPLGGQISFNASAREGAIPSARQARSSPVKEEVPNAREITSSESVPVPEVRPGVGEETPLRQQGEAAPARGQAGTEPARTEPETPQELNAMTPAAAGKLIAESAARDIPAHRVGVEIGLKMTEADVPALLEIQKQITREMVDAMKSGSEKAQKDIFSKQLIVGGAIEGARKSGPNYAATIGEAKPSEPPPSAGSKPAETVPPSQPEVAPSGEAVKAGGGVGSDAEIRDSYGKLTSASKQIRSNIQNGWSYVEGMTINDAIREMQTVRDRWQSELERLRRVKDGKEEATSEDIVRWRDDEGRLGKQIPIDRWVSSYEIGRVTENVIKTDRTLDAIDRLDALIKTRKSGNLKKDSELSSASEIRDRIKSIDNRRDKSNVSYNELGNLAKRQDALEKRLADILRSEQKPSAIANKLAAKLDALKSDVPKGRGSLGTFNIIPKVWDAAVEIAQAIIRKGGTVAEAIDAAIKHIRANNPSGWLEREARREMEAALSEAPKSAVELPEKQKTGTSEPAPRPAGKVVEAPPETGRGETLDDVYKIFEPDPKQRTPFRRKAVNVIEAVRTGLSSKFRPLNKLSEDIAKAYGTTKPKDIAGIFEQLKGSSGKAEADIYRFNRDVSKKVSGSEKDFNAYMFLRRSLDRLNQDFRDLEKEQAEPGSVKALNRRAVAGYTIPQLESKLTALEANLGPEKLAKFQEAADIYQKYMDDALRLQVESGRMSSEQYDAIKAGNQFYAPFKVMKYMELQSRPEGTGSKIDTMADFTKAMKGIEDPNFKLGDMLAAARQSILLSRILSEKNSAMRQIAEIAPFDVEGRFIRKLQPGAEAPQGMEIVKVLEAGKEKRYAVNPDVASALNIYGGNAKGIATKFAASLGNVFRAGATSFNLPFQVSNLLADIPRAGLMSKYGIRNPVDMVRFPLDFIHSLYSSLQGDLLGRENKLFQDFLDSGVAGTTIQEHLTPEMLRFREPTSISKSARLGRSVLSTLPRFAQAIEQSTKILGVKRAMRIEGVTSGKELSAKIPEAVTEIRRFSGSPDFGRQGKWVEAARLNLLYMFLNARIQGLVADAGRLTGRDGARPAAVAWFRIGTAVGIPTVYLWSLNNSPENREDYAKRSQQERNNYWLIPKTDENGGPRYITTEDGERIRDYWRVPKRESAKWIANLTESALDFAEKKDPESARSFANSMAQELIPVNVQGDTATEKLESVGSGLNPIIKAPLELMTGRDLYRHRNVIPERMKNASPEQQYSERTAEVFKVIAEKIPDIAPEFLRSPIILENLTKNLTAGLLTQFLKRKPVEGRSGAEQNPLLQRFQGLPYTDNTAFQEDIKGMEREAADMSLERHRFALKLLDENKGLPLATVLQKAHFKLDSNGKLSPEDTRRAEHVVDLWVAKQNGATYQDRQLLGLPVAQRAKYVIEQLRGAAPDKRNQLILDLARKRILTESVAEEMANQLKTE